MRDGPEFDGNTLVFGSCAAATVYRRPMIDDIGMFDEAYYACFEDFDLSFRAHRNRWYTVIKNVPSALLGRYLAQIIAAEGVVLASAARRGRLKVLLRARATVMREMPRLRVARRAIQARRRRSIEELDAVIRKDWFAHRMGERRREIAEAAAARAPSTAHGYETP